jgi:hypothetical protein
VTVANNRVVDHLEPTHMSSMSFRKIEIAWSRTQEELVLLDQA